ncbi:Hypothetical predicted protein [Olea europaea subsp. europaea]|uniref:GIR1-like zinc ribbon domain-containing protein n=1 Tax=Olea europaea subsp. europaea TaxID=158383 RepID=A0A8S0TP76_OLEEU|nr:Hypothetical predicted protein [Olea europaea subsp. europaea]
MATEVSSLVRLMNGGASNESASTGKSTFPITRDFLGGCSTLDSKELDLDLQVPSGWEKRLDLKSGNVYLQRCNSLNSSSSTSKSNPKSNDNVSKRQDLNFPPVSLNPYDDANLDLKLVLSSSNSVKSSNYQSVCTLDKVKFALERAEKESLMKQSMSKSKSSSSHSNSTSSTKDSETDKEKSSASFASGCPRCLLYVLISESNPLCPRCNCVVPLSMAVKKPRIDLNISS